MLNYSRLDENEADQIGLQYLIAAGYPPDGMVAGFKVLRQKSWMSGISVPTYLDARAGVDALLDQLLELERQRKTVTISYLKSQLYEVQKNLMQNIPFSLRLGELEARKASQEPITAAELKSLENDLKALNIRLYQLQQGVPGS